MKMDHFCEKFKIYPITELLKKSHTVKTQMKNYFTKKTFDENGCADSRSSRIRFLK